MVVVLVLLLVPMLPSRGAPGPDPAPGGSAVRPLDNDSEEVPFCESNATCGWTWASYPVSIRDNETAIWSVLAVSDALYVAVGSQGLILRSTDAGVDWTSVPSPLPTADNLVIAHGPGGSLWAGTDAGEFLQSEDDGLTWAADNASGIPHEVTTLAFPAPGLAYAAGPAGISLSTDGGTTWRPVALPAPETVRAAAFYPPGDGWLDLGTNGTVYYTNDSGAVWTAGSTNQPTARAVEIQPLGATAAWMLGIEGTVFQTANGLAWNSTQLATTQFTHSLLVLGGSTAWVVSDDANLFYTVDAGGCWDEEPVPNIPELYGLAFPTPSDGVVVGSGAIWYTRTAGVPLNGSTECAGAASPTTVGPYLVAGGIVAAAAVGTAVVVLLHRRRTRGPPASPISVRAAPREGRLAHRHRYRGGG